MAPLRRPLRIGTDCSGMETPILALRALGVEHQHMFSCDTDPNVKKQIYANFDVKEWFDDLMKRDNTTAPEVDLYVAGFPCQPYSAAGKRKGMKDKRAKVFHGCAAYLEEKMPRVFLLENVSKMNSHKTRFAFKQICRRLRTLADSGYHVEHHVMKTQEHGVPQSRSRIYFIGLRKDILPKGYKGFDWPEKLEEVSVDPFLDRCKKRPNEKDLPNRTNTTAFTCVKEALKRLKKNGVDPFKKTYVIDCDSSSGFSSAMRDKVPCMTASRGSGHWVTSRGRRMTMKEMLRCQGMDDDIKQVVSNNILGAQIGNAMSQNVVERIMVRLLPLSGLVPPGTKLTDRWVKRVKNTKKADKRVKKTSLKAKGHKRSKN